MSLTETLIETQPRKFGLWPSVWKLLRLRGHIWWNTFRRGKLRNKILTIVVLVLILGGMGLLFFLSALLLRFLNSPELVQYIDPGPLLHAIPTLVLTGAFIVIVMTNFGVLLQALYLSHDMDFLVTSPLPMRAVFISKMLEAILPTFALFCAFALPVLFGLGISSGYNILYYPLLVIMLAVLALAAGGLASILVMAVARIFPPRRVAEVLGLLGATASFLCGQSSNIIRAINPDRAAVTGTLNFFTQMNTPWSPMSWAGRGLQAIGSGDWLPGFGLTVLSLLLAGALFGGTLFLAEHLYYSGWSSMQASSRRKRPVRAAAAAPAAPVLPAAITPVSRAIHLIPRPIRGLMVKDFIVIRRDPRNLSGLIMPLVLGLIFLFTAQGPGRDPAEFLNEKGLSNLEVFGLLALALFVGWILLFTLATLSFSREGKNYWFIKSAPIRPWHLLTAKFLVAFVPSVAFSLLYLVIAYLIRGADWAYFPFITLIILMVMAGATGISLAFGAAGANLEWDDPRKMHLRGTTGCLVYIAVLAFMAVDLAFFVLPPVLWQIFTHGSSLWMYLGGSLFGIAIALVCAYLPLRMVVPRLPKIGEPD